MKHIYSLTSLLLPLLCCILPGIVSGQTAVQQPLDAVAPEDAPAISQSGDRPSLALEQTGTAETGPETETPGTSLISVKAYYFHGERRCKTCLAIEANTKGVIEKGYADEIAQGLVTWQSIDIDQKDNKHFEKEFDLMFSSVVLVKYRDGKQAEWKNLQKVWELVWDKPAFEDYIDTEMRAYLEP